MNAEETFPVRTGETLSPVNLAPLNTSPALCIPYFLCRSCCGQPSSYETPTSIVHQETELRCIVQVPQITRLNEDPIRCINNQPEKYYAVMQAIHAECAIATELLQITWAHRLHGHLASCSPTLQHRSHTSCVLQASTPGSLILSLRVFFYRLAFFSADLIMHEADCVCQIIPQSKLRLSRGRGWEEATLHQCS